MRFTEIWAQLVRKSPKLAKDDATVEFKAANLRALLRQVYEQGEKAGRGSAQPATPSFKDDMFNMFGNAGR